MSRVPRRNPGNSDHPSSADELRPVERLGWEEFRLLFRKLHKQGEHVAIVGPNGSGKSILGLELCKLRALRRTTNKRPASVVVLATKHRDSTLDNLGWPILAEWPPSYHEPNVIVWPRPREIEARAKIQRRVMKHVLDQIEDEGGHTVYIDEAAYFETDLPKGLGLSTTMDTLWRESRSNGITLIATTQRPRHVSVSMWSEPAWLIAFRVDDVNDLKRVAEISGERQAMLAEVDTLGGHEFICVHRPRAGERTMYRCKVELRRTP